MRLLPVVLLLIGFTSIEVAAQSAPARKDIPTIAKAANGSIVSIVMSDGNGKPIAQGTGFIASKDGLIVTNYHVIAEGSSAVAKLPDGAIYVLEGVVESDKERDVALVKATGRNFRTLTLGNSDRVEVGQEVVAIGNPLSLESTVSNGIVSGIRGVKEEGGQQLPTGFTPGTGDEPQDQQKELEKKANEAHITKYLQVTAPISPGSSGGPLFNMAGEVIGITTLYLKGGENLNFAIPINDAKRLLLDPYASSKKNLQKSGLELAPVWPNEAESAEVEKHENEAPPSSSTTASGPDLKTAVDFMGRMVEPEHRLVLGGVMNGAILHSSNGAPLTIVSDQPMLSVLATGVTQKKGYPEFTYSIVSDSEKHEQKDFPRYTSFALGDIDPSSIESMEGGYDPSALADFWDKHPRCEANPECSQEYIQFLKSAPKLTMVLFHTTDLKPLIERGDCSGTSGCRLTDTTGRVLILFQNKDRAERFVTALTYAAKFAGGKPDLFPPTHYSKKD